MDIKSKSLRWIENMCNTFETAYQEMDGLLSKDNDDDETMLSNASGDGVEKFSSDVVQNSPLPLVEATEFRHGFSITNSVNTSAYTGTDVDFEHDLSPIVHLTNKFSSLAMNEHEEVDSNFDSEENGDGWSIDSDLGFEESDDELVDESADVYIEEYSFKEQTFAPDGSYPERLVNEVNTVISMNTIEESDSDLAREKSDDVVANENSDDASANDNTDLCIEERSAKETDLGGLVLNDGICDDESIHGISSIFSNSDMGYSVVSCETKTEETGSLTSLSKISYSTIENPTEEAVSLDNPVCVTDHVSNSSIGLTSVKMTTTASNENKVEDTIPFSSVMPLDLIGTLDDDFNDDDDDDESIFENIKLSDMVKMEPEDNCAVINDSELHAVSRRTQRLRSFKRKIQDALFSNKRLTKQYEQLAVWFGDVDIGPDQGSVQNLLQSTSTLPPDSINSEKHPLDDSQWELL